MGSVSSSAANPEYREVKNTDKNGEEPKPGDLIEIFRNGFKHWAVYIGQGNVVHFVFKGVGSSSSCTLPAAGETSFVLKQKLEDVVGGDKWRINNYLDKKYEPQQINKIVNQAVESIGTQLPYNLLTFNCEHFATDLRYGKSTSRQAINAGVFGGLIVLVFGTLALVGLGPARN